MYHLYTASGEHPESVLLKRGADHHLWDHIRSQVLIELGGRAFSDEEAIGR